MPENKTKQQRPATYDHLRKKQPIEKLVPVPLDAALVEAYEKAVEAVEALEIQGADTSAAEKLRDTSRKALEAETVVLRFRSIGRKRYDKLIHDHPATEEQHREHKEQYGQRAPHNIDTFAPALIAASCIEPEMTIEQVTELFDEWNPAEVMDLYTAALEVNTQRRVVDLGKAYG